MGYIKIEWPESQNWLDLVEFDEETGETIGEIEYGPDSSVFVPEDIYEMGPDEYAETLKTRFTVWSDSGSKVEVYEDFADLESAAEFAHNFVHNYDNKDFRVTVYIEDNLLDDTIETYENIMVGDICYPVED